MTERDSTLRAALAELVRVIGNRHFGRMPEEVQTAYDAARAALAQPEHEQREAGPDPRFEHLLEGFDNLIYNADDDYSRGYMKAMRKELSELAAAALAQPEHEPEQQLDIAATMMVAAFEKRPDLWDSFSVSLMEKISTECAGQVPAKATSGKRPPLATTPDPAHPPPAPERPALSDERVRKMVNECGLDWQRGYAPLFDGDDTNRYAVLVREVERALKGTP